MAEICFCGAEEILPFTGIELRGSDTMGRSQAENMEDCDVVPVARFEAFMALKLPKSDSFRSLEFSRLVADTLF